MTVFVLATSGFRAVATLGLLLRHCGCSPWHSLCYYYLQVSEPSQGLPQFFLKAYLDEQPIARYHSHTRRMEPLVSWMEEIEKKNANHGKETNKQWLASEQVFRDELKRTQQNGGLHTWQAILGCELKEGGRHEGYFHYGYDGSDFISFDKKTLRWVTAHPWAEEVKQTWENNTGWSQGNKFYLEETCILLLKRYLSYRKEALQRTEPPVGQVTHKTINDNRKTLICQAYGFYPKEIEASWMRDGVVCKHDTFHRNVVPNSDGTYFVWLSIEISPKERHHFSCHIKHDSLQEPLVLNWKEESCANRRLHMTAILGPLVVIPLVLGIIC